MKTAEEQILKKKIYFISDAHLGVPDATSSRKRELLLVKWLDMVKADAEEIYLMGDIFDFWFEYKTVVPKGFVRLLGKLAELSDSGIKINYFTGNHDMWISKYFCQEMNFNIFREPISKIINGKKILIGHGDGLGPDDHGYKFIKKVFSNKVCQWLFSTIHPGFGIKLALFFSRRSRVARGDTDEIFLGEDQERLIVYAKNLLKSEHFDYFIFGHRHLPLDIKLSETSRYLNIGDWIVNFTYLEFDGNDLELKKFNCE
jgi:UDP-2,3-diacylglucosamine hydrolase